MCVCVCVCVLLQGAEVTVFEMGRGAGGRMATRKTRDLPGLAINHGV